MFISSVAERWAWDVEGGNVEERHERIASAMFLRVRKFIRLKTITIAFIFESASYDVESHVNISSTSLNREQSFLQGTLTPATLLAGPAYYMARGQLIRA